MSKTDDPSVYQEDELTYNDYLKIPEILSLQQPLSDPIHHDEMLFIIIHQAYELWFKLILHELEQTIRYMQEDNTLRAHHFLNRCVQIFKLVLIDQIHILETMTPMEFLEFRDTLLPASGFQSLQFRELEFLAGLKDDRYFKFFENKPEMTERLMKRRNGPDLRLELYEHIRRKGFHLPDNCRIVHIREHDEDRELLLKTLRQIHSSFEDWLPLYLLVETAVEFDQNLSLWREHHVRVVERIIGAKRGTGGSSGVKYLRSTTERRIFPYLWEVRTILG